MKGCPASRGFAVHFDRARKIKRLTPDSAACLARVAVPSTFTRRNSARGSEHVSLIRCTACGQVNRHQPPQTRQTNPACVPDRQRSNLHPRRCVGARPDRPGARPPVPAHRIPCQQTRWHPLPVLSIHRPGIKSDTNAGSVSRKTPYEKPMDKLRHSTHYFDERKPRPDP